MLNRQVSNTTDVAQSGVIILSSYGIQTSFQKFWRDEVDYIQIIRRYVRNGISQSSHLQKGYRQSSQIGLMSSDERNEVESVVGPVLIRIRQLCL